MDVKAYVLLFSAVVLVAAQDSSSQLIKQPGKVLPGIGEEPSQDGSSQLNKQPTKVLPGGLNLNVHGHEPSCVDMCYSNNEENEDELHYCLDICDTRNIRTSATNVCSLFFDDEEEQMNICLGSIDELVMCHKSCNSSYSKDRPICKDDHPHDFSSSLCYKADTTRCHFEEQGKTNEKKICDVLLYCLEHTKGINNCAGAVAFCRNDCVDAWYGENLPYNVDYSSN